MDDAIDSAKPHSQQVRAGIRGAGLGGAASHAHLYNRGCRLSNNNIVSRQWSEPAV